MKQKAKNILFSAIILNIVYFGCLPDSCFANPVSPDGKHIFSLLLWVGCSFLEAVIIVMALRSRFNRFLAMTATFLVVTLLNIVTIPLTQYLGSYLYIEFSMGSLVLIELIPIIIEFLVFFVLFKYLAWYDYISDPVPIIVVAFLTIGTNLLTFVIGLVYYYH